MLEDCKGLDTIESLQSHENINIYRKSWEIITKYFTDDDDVPDLVWSRDAVYKDVKGIEGDESNTD